MDLKKKNKYTSAIVHQISPPKPTLLLSEGPSTGEAAYEGFESGMDAFVNIHVRLPAKCLAAMTAVVRLRHLKMELTMTQQSPFVSEGLETNWGRTMVGREREKDYVPTSLRWNAVDNL